MKGCFRRASLFAALPFVVLEARPAVAQEVSFHPVFYLGAGYDSNIFLRAEDPVEDWFGHATVQLPLVYKSSPRSTLTASYLVGGEWYQEQSQLDAFPSRQTGSVSYSYAPTRGATLNLRGSYNESQRPEDVFIGSGIDFGRQRARTASGGITLGHSLGLRGRLALDYDYTRASYLENQTTQLHGVSLTLSRQFSRRTNLDAKYAYDHYLFSSEDAGEGSKRVSHVGTLGLAQELGQRTNLSLRAGGRITGDLTTPEVEATLTRTWRGGALSVSYAHTQAFVPTREAQTSLSEVDRGSLSLSFLGRRYRVSLTPSYFRNRVDELRSDTWRASFDAVYNVAPWVGFGGIYQYTWQESTDIQRDQAKRHTARINLVITPWPDRPRRVEPGNDASP